MKFSELPIKIQEHLLEEKKQLHVLWYENSETNVSFTNIDGTRFFYARKGHDCWFVYYGNIGFKAVEDAVGASNYLFVRSGKQYRITSEGYKIPVVAKDKEHVLEIARNIGNMIMEF